VSLAYDSERVRQHTVWKEARERLWPAKRPVLRPVPAIEPHPVIDPIVDNRPRPRDWLMVATDESKLRRVNSSQVMAAVARVFDWSITDMKSARRQPPVVEARHVAMAITKQLTLLSLPQIGKRFGGRDHTTVLNACRKMAPVVEQVKQKIPVGSPPDLWATAMQAELLITRPAKTKLYREK
jgi:hypothetical protein